MAATAVMLTTSTSTIGLVPSSNNANGSRLYSGYDGLVTTYYSFYSRFGSVEEMRITPAYMVQMVAWAIITMAIIDIFPLNANYARFDNGNSGIIYNGTFYNNFSSVYRMRISVDIIMVISEI